jgi:hypothetical protein
VANPENYVDRDFGALVFDSKADWYEGSRDWEGQRVAFHVHAESSADLERGLEIGRKVWSDQRGWSERVREFAVANLLELQNETWSEDEADKVTADEFRGRMKLKSIGVYEDGAIVFWHEDGDMFGGHSITVTCDLTQGPRDADIEG